MFNLILGLVLGYLGCRYCVIKKIITKIKEEIKNNK